MPVPSPSRTQPVQLVRAIGRWSLIALTINSIIGSGVFGLPSTIAGIIGRASVWGVVLAGVCVGVIMICFAEVSSHFDQAGGPYLYARTAFGQFAGIQTGWMLWLSQVAAPAANANLFVIYLAEFFPRAATFWWRLLVLTLLVWFLAAVNVAGVAVGTRISNFFTVAKLLPLIAVIGMGLVLHPQTHAAVLPEVSTLAAWSKSLLLIFFFYGGFESAILPMSEAKNPRRDAPIALLTALGLCCVIYTLIQWLVVTLLPNAATSERPIADLARLLGGPSGAAVVTVGALCSVYGYLGARMLSIPRVTMALADNGDLPGWFAKISPRFRTPYVSILIFAAAVWIFALSGHFAWNVTLSAVSRLFYYAIVCAALPALRRTHLGGAQFRVPGGVVLAVIGILICLALLTRADFKQTLILGATILLAAGNWLWARRRATMLT